MRWLTKAAAWAALGVVLVLSACGGGSKSGSGSAQLRLMNANSGYASLDLKVDDVAVNTAVASGTVGAYASVGTSAQTHTVYSTGSTTALSTTVRTLASGSSYTAVAYGASGALKTALIDENVVAADAGKAKLLVLNLATDAGTLDVYLTGSNDTLDSAVPLAVAVQGGGSVGYVTTTSGDYRLRITGSGDKTDLRLDAPVVTLPSTGVATLLVTPGGSGLLVNALLLNHKGTLASLATSLSRVRVVAAVAANTLVSATVAGTAVLPAATSPTIGEYVQLPSGNASVQLVVGGNPVTMLPQALTAGSDYTLLVWGTADQPKLTAIVDDNRLPSAAGNAKIRLVHGVAGLTSPLTLTVDFSAVASNVAQGQASAFTEIGATGTGRLDVTYPLSSGPLYTLTGAPLAAKGLYTVFMFGDAAKPSAAIRKER